MTGGVRERSSLVRRIHKEDSSGCNVRNTDVVPVVPSESDAGGRCPGADRTPMLRLEVLGTNDLFTESLLNTNE